MNKIILVLLLQFSALAFAQPGSLDTNFDPGNAAIDNVFATAIQSDGKIIVGGRLPFFSPSAPYLFRLNSDGSVDNSFKFDQVIKSCNGPYCMIRTIVLQPDGKILIGGCFTISNGNSNMNSIARLNSDGSLDGSFDAGTGLKQYSNVGDVFDIALQTDGKIVICGEFDNYNGSVRNRIARINADGTLDNSFNSGSGADYGVDAIAIQSDGKIIIVGDFETYNGVSIPKIARLNPNGNLDTSFKPGSGGTMLMIHDVVIQKDGKVVIVGQFWNYNGTQMCGIARLNPNGSIDTGFNPGTAASSIVYCVALLPDGKIIIGGEFNSFNGVERNRIARLNQDGSLDMVFNPGAGANGYVMTTSIQSDGKIIIGGYFNFYADIKRNYVARINGDVLPPLVSPQSFCGSATVADLVATGTNLKWYSTASANSALSPNDLLYSGTYHVSQTAGGFESTRTAVAVTINTPVTPSFTQVNSICLGGTLQALPATSNNNIAGTWSPVLDTTKTTTYTFTPTAGQCATFANMTIAVNPIVTSTFTQINPICAGTALALPTTSDNSVTGTWSPAMNNATTTNYTFTPSAGSCGTTATMIVEVNALPDIESDYIKIICSGNNETVLLNAGLLSGFQSDYSYEWSKNDELLSYAQSYELSVKTDGVYTCDVKNKQTGCMRTRTNTVTYSETVAIKDTVISDLKENNTVTIAASGDAEYSLDNPEGPFQDSNRFENVAPGIYTVYVKDKKGCGMVSKTIAVVGAPPFFTPNGDSYNDTWKLEGVSASYLRNTRVDILDRFGKLLKVIPNAESEGWDGTYQGHPMPADDYWFVAHLEDGRQGRGHFALKR